MGTTIRKSVSVVFLAVGIVIAWASAADWKDASRRLNDLQGQAAEVSRIELETATDKLDLQNAHLEERVKLSHGRKPDGVAVELAQRVVEADMNRLELHPSLADLEQMITKLETEIRWHQLIGIASLILAAVGVLCWPYRRNVPVPVS